MQLKFLPSITISSIKIIFIVAIFWMAFANASFFGALTKDYPGNADNIGFLLAIIIGYTGMLIVVMALLCVRYTMKPLLIIVLLSSPFAAYFMDSYNILIDDSMIKNTFETDAKEALELLSPTLGMYVLLLGIIPSVLVCKVDIVFKPFKQELLARAKLVTAILIVMLILFFVFSATFSSFLREHKTVQYYFNPGNYVIGVGRYVRDHIRSDKHQPIKLIGLDAHIPESDVHRELIIMVVGETARADRFSLNGYHRNTNPLLKQQQVVSFSDVTSCATLTALSVPCMFSLDTESDFNANKARYTENALDILSRAGVNILWRDNNSSSKGVAHRVAYQDYRDSDVNTICDVECRDEGMLVGLQNHIDSQKEGDVFIILHQMGNHGPAYYKRYPKAFEVFIPACQTNELSDCSIEEINNAYDNAILYTDYFLNKTIELLKRNDDTFETAMLYISDHGESLGESGLYLHGLPNFIAPQNQRHVPMIMWIGKNFDEIDYDALAAKKDMPLTHDTIFHTLLGLMEVQSDIYNRDMDIIRN